MNDIDRLREDLDELTERFDEHLEEGGGRFGSKSTRIRKLEEDLLGATQNVAALERENASLKRELAKLRLPLTTDFGRAVGLAADEAGVPEGGRAFYLKDDLYQAIYQRLRDDIVAEFPGSSLPPVCALPTISLYGIEFRPLGAF